MQRTICVTGGTGFVGRQVISTLLERGYCVRALVRSTSASKLPKHQNLDDVDGDVLKPSDIENALTGCDALIHLVGTRREQMKRTGVTYADIDLGSVKAAVRAMKAAGVERILLLSAASIGNSVYVQTKKLAEQEVRRAGLQWTIFRPSFIIAKGQQWPIVMSPFLNAMALLPGRIGDIAKRARNITRDELVQSMLWSLEHDAAIVKIFDVPAIRKLTRGVA